MTKLQQLRDLVMSKGLNFVGTRGNLNAPVCIVGEAPDKDEDAQGIPFVGAAGQQLDGQLAETNLTDVWYANPFHVRPPDNDLDRRGELGIPDELQIEAFLEELNATKPTFIVCCGATPTGILCPETVDRRNGKVHISSYRGSLLRSPLLGWPHYVIPNLHPSYILRQYSDRCEALLTFDKVGEELKYWRQHGILQPLPERELIDDPSADDVLSYLEECNDAIKRGEYISHDIENPFYERIKIPYSFNFAFSSRRAISFNLFDYPDEKLVKIWRKMDGVLRRAKLVGQNYINFDTVYMEESIGLHPNIEDCHDTMTRHKILWPEFPHTLHFQTFQYTREPYYKDEGKQWNPREGKRRLRNYGCKDAAVTLEVFEAQDQELDSRGLRHFYETVEMPGARNYHFIEKRGLLVDTAKLDQLRRKIDEELDRICKDATGVVGKLTFPSKEKADGFIKFAKTTGRKVKPDEVFNLGSPKQILNEFNRLGIYLPSEDGKLKTDEEALQKSVAKTGHKLPGYILQSRGLSKLRGTNVNAVLVDNILLTSYTTTGTVNGRRSSSSYFDGTRFVYGSNLQNLPKHGKGIIHDFQMEYRECLVARPGMIFLACDQMQAEDWIVQGIIADQGGGRTGFDQLLQGVDRHCKLASFIFKKPESACGKESHERYLGKKTRHAGNYDMQAFRFAAVLAKEGFHVPEKCRQCKRVHRNCEVNTTDLLIAFHQYDPGIKQVFHRYIQEKLETTRTLCNPFGRERIFFGLHPYRDNSKVFKEAYSCLPQSTVSDNTLQAVNFIEREYPERIVKEDHDAITLEIPDTDSSILDGMLLMSAAFDREIRLEKGLAFRIPIEFEIGYNLKTMKGVDRNNVLEIREKLRATRH